MLYLDVPHNLLSTCTSSDVIKDTDNGVRRLRQYLFTVQEYTYNLAVRALKFGEILEINELMGNFVEGLTDNNRLDVQHY